MATLSCGGTHVGVAPMFMRIGSQVMRLYRYREQGPRARKAKTSAGSHHLVCVLWRVGGWVTCAKDRPAPLEDLQGYPSSDTHDDEQYEL